LLDEFHRHRLGAEIEDIQFAKADKVHFDDVVKGTIARIGEIDAALASKLADGWKLERLDKTMLQLLRAGTYELMARSDITTGTAISEYVDVAHAFFEAREAKFVNGVLDSVAKSVR
jgi:N utilization substance protein B